MQLQSSLGIASMHILGPSEAARAAMNRSLAIAEARGDLLTQVAMLRTLSVFSGRQGEFQIALDHAKRARAVSSSYAYGSLTSPPPWIRTRRQRRAPVMQMPEGVEPGDLVAESGPVESIEDLVGRRQLSAVVEEAMALLPEEQRTAIILKEYHGMTFQEIADMQGCPLSTVKTRLYQGLTVLRRHLEKNGQLTPQLVKRS